MRSRRFARLAAVAAPLIAVPMVVQGTAHATAAGGPSAVGALSAAQAALLSTNVTEPVVVLFKDQHPEAPATPADIGHRTQVLASDQAPVLKDLAQTRSTDIKTYKTLNAVAATVSAGEESRLASDPSVSQVIPDSTIPLATTDQSAANAASSGSSGASTTAGSQVCDPNGQVELAPQALEDTHTDSDVPGAQTARSLGFNGAGVKVAFMADGLDINNPDFVRADGSHVFVDYQDFTGEGTAAPTAGGEAFLDASSISAQGRQTYNVANYSDLPDSQPCNIRIEGMAPGASLVGLKVFAESNATLTSNFLQAIDYAVSTDHVDVLSESFGSNYFSDTAQDAVREFDEDAVAAGTTVVVSSGDAGVTSTIGSPATDPAVISAGATTTYRLDEQTGYGGARWSNGTYLNDNISSFSSGGFTQANRTVDLVAPGELNWALCSTDTAMYAECTNYAGKPSDVQATGGTSESAPLTAGAAALVIQAYRQAHRGASPTPAAVKQILTSTADDISAPGDQQGAGRLDSYKAVQAAESYRVAPQQATGSTFLDSSDQLNTTAAAGAPQHLTEQVTDNSGAPETISASTRTLGSPRQVSSTTVTLADSDNHITDWQGATDNVQEVQFTVPAGQSRLSASTSQDNANPADAALHERVRMTLIDPTGALASYDVPQGDGNYDNAQVANPAAGTWTAYIYSRDSAAGGYTGPVEFGATVANYQSFGSVSPSTVQLAPGQSTTVAVNFSAPATPGDQAASLVLGDGAGTTTVPITVRTLVPVSNRSTTNFTGTMTGGNGRGSTYAQQFTYQFNLNQAPELNVNVVAPSSADRIATSLVSPGGNIVASSTNQEAQFTSTGVNAEPLTGQQDHVLAPTNGLWTLLVNLYLPSGTAISQPYSVSIDEQPVVASANVPATIGSGQTVTTDVKVTNHGSSPEEYFVDPRLDSQTTIQLQPLGASPQLTLPLTLESSTPGFVVPTDTSAIGAGVQASVPVTFDMVDNDGYSDPDVPSLNAGTTAVGLYAANPVEQGVWSVNPQEVGPYGPNGAPAATADEAMVAQTQAFDTAVTPSTGDLWEQAINADEGLSPVIVQPGQSAAIPVTITANARRGSVDRGVLYVDDLQLFSSLSSIPTAAGPLTTDNGSQLAAVPYSFRVG